MLIDKPKTTLILNKDVGSEGFADIFELNLGFA